MGIDISLARGKIKAMKRAAINSLEDFDIDKKYKKSRTGWLKASIKVIDAMYGEFNLLIVRKEYKSTKDRVNMRLYFTIGADNSAGLINVKLDTKKMTVEQSELRGYISAHAFERIISSEYVVASSDFLSAYVDLLKSLIKPEWSHGGGLNIYTKHGVLCAIKDIDTDGKPMFVIKTFIKAESFDLGSAHEKHHQMVLNTGENQTEFVRKPRG